MSELMVVTGAGPVGTTVAMLLAEQGKRVRVLTRSGSGPEHTLIERRAVDVRDEDALAAAAEGAGAIFHCIHGTAYAATTWAAELPEADRVVLEAGRRNDAVVVFPESLYSYTHPELPMAEDNPRDWPTGKGKVRADLLRNRAASPTNTVSVVAGDFYGPGVRTSHLGERIVPSVLAGKKVRMVGSVDQPHSWTYVPDLARAMVAAAERPELWNRVLHAPTASPRTQREMVHALAGAAGVAVPEPGALPVGVLKAIGLVHGGTRELAEMGYQFTAPFVMKSKVSEDLLGLSPTDVDDGAHATIEWWRAQAS